MEETRVVVPATLPVEIEGKLFALEARVDVLVVVDEESMRVAQELLKACNLIKKEVRDLCAPGIKDAYDRHKDAKRQEADLIAPVLNIDQSLRDKLSQFAREEEEKKQKAREAIGKTDVTVHMESPVDKGGFRTVWRWKTDAIDKVPREYMIVDDRAITAAVNTLKEKCKIPGISVWSEKVPVAR